MTAEQHPGFLFGEAADATVEQAKRVVRIPRGLERKSELLAALATALQMPHYFGSNWDALSDCLRDLSWLPEPEVVLLHGDLPTAKNKHRRAYVDVLADATASWNDDDKGSLAVVFPAEAEAEVRELLAELDED